MHEGPLHLDPTESEAGAFVAPRRVEDVLRAEPSTSWLGPTWALLVRHLAEAGEGDQSLQVSDSPSLALREVTDEPAYTAGSQNHGRPPR